MIINNYLLDIELITILNDLKLELNKYGLDFFSKGFKQSSNDIMVQCPYHAEGHEKRPSAGIRKSDGQFHCFTCGEVHTLPEVISYCFGKNDLGVYGWTWLIKKYRFTEIEERKDITVELGRNNHKYIQNNLYITQKELDSYRYYHPYMYKRKLTDEIIELFDIGYDKETDCITFPIKDINGNTLEVARRSTKGKYFNYPTGFEKPLYGMYEYLNNNLANTIIEDGQVCMEDVDRNEVIVCESMIDALTCWVYGKYAVALNGLGTELQFRQLRELPCRKLILATDNDEAGMKARKRIRKNIPNKVITEYILPEGKKDINELSKEEFDNLKEVFS